MCIRDRVKESRFPKALRTLSPSPIKIERDKEYNWTDTVIIKYRGIPVGAFSPSTLVFSAADYNSEFTSQFEQKAGKSSDILDNDGFLCPPKSDNDLLAIAEWLHNLIKVLGGSEEPPVMSILNLSDEENQSTKELATMVIVLSLIHI